MQPQERLDKYERQVLNRIKNYLVVNKEASIGMIYISDLSVKSLENGLKHLLLSGHVIRRQICLSPTSSRLVWAYRLADQPEYLTTFEPPPKRSISPERKARVLENKENRKLEKMHHTILRLLPLPRFEGYPEQL